MGRNQNIERFRRPEIFFSELINNHARGDIRTKDEHVQTWYRALVVAVDVFGGRLENPDGEGTTTHKVDGKSIDVKATVGPTNPRNSIKARILSNEFDQFIGDEDLRVFWPMLGEHDAVPIKPGEHVYITFEDEAYEHGLWLGKVSGDENINYYRGQDKYEIGEGGRLLDKFPDTPPDPNAPANDTDAIAGGRQINDRDLNANFGDSPED